MSTADVVIVGGGVVGSSIGYHLRKAAPDRRVVIVERDATYARASSNLAMGGIRQQFTLAANVALVRYSVAFYQELKVNFRQRGYLFLGNAESEPRLIRRFDAMRAAGARVVLLSRDEIHARLPDAFLDDITVGILGPEDGYANPPDVLRAMRARAEDAGVAHVDGEVTSIERANGRITSVRVGASTIDTNVVVNAAGPFASRVAALADVIEPVVPVRQQLFRCELPRHWPYRFPMVVDPDGLHWRHDDAEPGGSDRIICAKTRLDEAPGENFECDESRWLADYYPSLVRRMPALKDVRGVRGWAGLYEMTPDHNPIIGEAPELPGFFMANGFSGHGLMMAPAVGRAVADLIVSGMSASLDISAFGVHRFRGGALLSDEATI